MAVLISDPVSLDQHAHTIHHCLQLRTISGNKTSGSQHPVTGDRSGIFILVGSVILSTVWCLGFQCWTWTATGAPGGFFTLHLPRQAISHRQSVCLVSTTSS